MVTSGQRDGEALRGQAATSVRWADLASPGYQRAKSPARSLLRTRVRTCRSRWAPRGDQRICCFLTMRRLMTWLTVASAVAVEIGSPRGVLRR